MTPLITRLSEIRKRLERATPGPWEAKFDGGYSREEPKELEFLFEAGVYPVEKTNRWNDLICDFAYDGTPFGDEKRVRANQDFVVHSPADIAFLLQAVEVMREALVDISKSMEKFTDYHGQTKMCGTDDANKAHSALTTLEKLAGER